MNGQASPGTIQHAITYGYDVLGRVLTETDNLTHSLTSVFDRGGRLTSTAIAGPQWSGTKTVSYQYDASGNRTRLIWPDAYYTQYCYDALNRMSFAAENSDAACAAGKLATYSYDLLSRRSGLTDGGTAAASYTYTAGGDLLTLVHALAGTTDDVTATLAYTATHKLKSQVLSNAAYIFAPTNATTSYTANGLNQYTTATGLTLGYDSNGSLTSDGTWTYGYDVDNRLTSATKTGVAASYAYDPRGRRVLKTVGGVNTSFLLDGDNEIAEYNAAGALTLRYVPGPAIDNTITQKYRGQSRINRLAALT